MMVLGSALQTNGLGSWLWVSTKRLMAVCSATREWNTAFQAAFGELGEEGLDRVEPGTRRGCEVKDPPRMANEPLPHFGLLMGAVVVEDDVDQLAGRHGALDGIEEAQELLMPVALHQRPSTVPSSTLRAANRLVTPLRR